VNPSSVWEILIASASRVRTGRYGWPGVAGESVFTTHDGKYNPLGLDPGVCSSNASVIRSIIKCRGRRELN
jgi:hypothetical protein